LSHTSRIPESTAAVLFGASEDNEVVSFMGPEKHSAAMENNTIAAAMAVKGRPPRDRARDGRDHTLKILTFAAVVSGEIVADFLPFRGYYTRLFSSLVGERGRTYAVIPRDLTRIPRIREGGEEIAAFAKAIRNITLIDGVAESAGELPEPVDLFFISQNYHDLHDPFMGPVPIAKFNTAVFTAMKPGGRLIVIDHVAAQGAPQDVTNSKHRIEPAIARREIEAAGFHFDGHSDALSNPADKYGLSIFAHGVRYHTDRFVYRFRKPL
jgi:predicted methyltransferase